MAETFIKVKPHPRHAQLPGGTAAVQVTRGRETTSSSDWHGVCYGVWVALQLEGMVVHAEATLLLALMHLMEARPLTLTRVVSVPCSLPSAQARCAGEHHVAGPVRARHPRGVQAVSVR